MQNVTNTSTPQSYVKHAYFNWRIEGSSVSVDSLCSLDFGFPVVVLQLGGQNVEVEYVQTFITAS